MKSNFHRLLAVAGALLGLSAPALAQQAATVTGRVTDEANNPIRSASVAITQLGVGTYTNAQGQYSFTVPAARVQGQQVTITAKAIGHKPGTATITLAGGPITQNFTLQESVTQLSQVVTTALGIEQDKRSIGTSQQNIDSASLTRTRTSNIVSTLSGKVAGITVTSASTQGGSARIVIRGANSIAGSNEPLFVIDGVPVDNSNFANSTLQRGYGGFDYGNAIQDLNPSDIAELNVLKGPAAAALYGSRAANGAVIITTKNGRGASGFNVTASTNVTFETPLRLPEYQNTYGQGSGGAFSYVDGNYGGVNDGVDESWGPKLDGQPRSQFSTTVAGAAEVRPWVAHPNNVRDFFELGRTAVTSVAAQGANDKANFRLSLTNQEVAGIVPNNSLKRVNASLNAGAQVSDKLNVTGNIQYSHNAGQNRPGTGYDAANPMMGFVWFGRQVDVRALRNHKDTLGNQLNWNYSYHNNPYWAQYENSNRDDRDRVIGSASADYQVTDWLTAKLRTGTDFYRDFRVHMVAAGWTGGYFDGDYAKGGFREATYFNNETNTDFLLTARHSLMSNLGMTVNFGGNRRATHYRVNSFGTDELVIPGTYNISNSAKPVIPFEQLRQKRINSVYGQAQFAYNDYLFVDVTGRNDWSSTLPKQNNSYFYPSVSTSFIFTDAVPMLAMGGRLTSGKLRGGWSRVGNDAEPYQLQSTFTPGTPFGAQPQFSVPNTIANADLKPESTESWEIGTDLEFFENRLGLSLTYYDKVSSNQILTADVSPASGFTNKVINAGTISNKGLEAMITATPVRLDNGFKWDMTVNYAANKSMVEELHADLQTVTLGPSHWFATIEARKGEPYGAIYGAPYKRDAQGRLILRGGRPLPDVNKRVLGHYPPDWTGGINNAFSFKGFDLNVLVETRQGGNVYSTGNMFGSYAGVLKETEFRPDTGLLIEGIDEATGAPNTVHVTTENYFHSLYRIQERWVYDASWVKLREVRFGVAVPSTISNRFGVSTMSAALVGRNLALWAKAPHIDPETAFSSSNLQGIDMGQLPSTRSIGFQLTVTP